MQKPSVWSEGLEEHTKNNLMAEAAIKFRIHQLPSALEPWLERREALRTLILQKAGISIDHSLDLDCQWYDSVTMEGYTIRKVMYQSRPGVKVTANLYVPDGDGPFPAVINLHGHWGQGKIAARVQARGHTLAKNGYVCLCVDAWGSGERASVHGTFEYHGGNLGLSLLDIGESLLGAQIVDNSRGIDLLCSLPFVDTGRIGATGASGGGNQTMWLAAIDERVAAALPVVSVGSFQSYVMRSNCVCELLVDGLLHLEESAVLALAAPRALKLCNCLRDSNPTFYAAEMLRSFKEARKIFQAYGVDDKLSYQIFDLEHGYWPEIRETMLGFFDLHLKGVGSGAPRRELPFETLPEERLMLFPAGTRDASVKGIAEHCRRRGAELRAAFLGTDAFDVPATRAELAAITRKGPPMTIKAVHEYAALDGWRRLAVEASDNRVIPLLAKASATGRGAWAILVTSKGKDAISDAMIDARLTAGEGVLLLDLYGTGEVYPAEQVDSQISLFHTLARGLFWLGKTLIGEWIRDIELAGRFASEHLDAKELALEGIAEAGVAALFHAALGGGDIRRVKVIGAPVSYAFTGSGIPHHFNMATHLPGILKWGDLSLAAALSECDTTFADPRLMDGTPLAKNEYPVWEKEYATVKQRSALPGRVHFQSSPDI